MSRFERLAFIPHLMKRWPSYFVLAVQCKKANVQQTVTYVQGLQLPDRVSIVVMPVKPDQHKFYVNKLRNLAIKAIRTTHFIPFDMDMWPNRSACFSALFVDNLYSELISLPSEILNSNETAVIIPAMFIKPSLVLPNCTSIMDCALKSESFFPTNKSELRKCLHKQVCTTMKERGMQHVVILFVFNYSVMLHRNGFRVIVSTLR